MQVFAGRRQRHKSCHVSVLLVGVVVVVVVAAHFGNTNSVAGFLPSTTVMSRPAKVNAALFTKGRTDDGYDGLGEYDPSEGLRPQREVLVGDPQLRVKESDRSVTSILRELAAIQQQGPQKYCILGTRHCSYLHQQIIELLYVCVCEKVLLLVVANELSKIFTNIRKQT